MVPRISIEEHPVDVLGLPTWAIHLYLVYEGDLGDEYVLRAGPKKPYQLTGGDMRIEDNVPIERSADARGGDTPAERSSTKLTFPGKTADEAWTIMVKYAREIEASGYDYNAFKENSNAFAGALVFAAGGTPSKMLPTGVDPDTAIGFGSWHKIVADIAPPADGSVEGTAAGEILRGIQTADVILALGGNDTVFAGRGDDRVTGSGGMDRLWGEAGADRLWGNAGGDLLVGAAGNDILRGGAGDDTLVGNAGNDWLVGDGGDDRLAGGPGNDRLTGGAGADTFDFASGGGADRVDDFILGTDRLEILSDAVHSFSDLALSRSGAGGGDLRLAFDGTSIVLHHVDLDHFGAGDVVVAPPDDLLA